MLARDDLAVLIAIGLLAYASADIAHHVLGHGGACLLGGGRILSLSSVYVDCTVRGTTIDLAGPFANLLLGMVALIVARWRADKSGAAMALFLALTTAFNLFWFFLQLVFSVATGTDDWAWALHQFHASEAMRYGLIAFGAFGYWFTLRMASAALAGFTIPLARLRRIVWSAWLTAGTFACLTALFDPAPAQAILHHAAPQSFGLAIGLLLIPRRADGTGGKAAPALGNSPAWLAAAVLVAGTSIAWLGPGFAV